MSSSPEESNTKESDTGQTEEVDTRSKEEIEADLAATREHLAESVDALGDKLNVKARGQEKATQLKDERGQEIAIGAGVAVALLVVVIVWRKRRS